METIPSTPCLLYLIPPTPVILLRHPRQFQFSFYAT